jgi:uncharacterized delta-60 repeat protein
MKSARTNKSIRRSAFLRGNRRGGLQIETLESRCLLAGQLDAAFGNGGRVLTDYADFTSGVGSEDVGRAVLVQGDGKTIAAGVSTLNGVPQGTLARFNANGSLDTSFGLGGKISTGFLTSINDIALTTGGKIIAVGPVAGPTIDFGVIQLNADGSLDETGFGSRGAVAVDIAGFDDTPQAVAIQADGKIVVAGDTGLAGINTDFAVIRLLASGNLDTTFDTDGKQTVNFGVGLVVSETAYDVAIDGSNRIVLAGSSSVGVGGTLDFALARLDASGVLDATFSTDGKVTTDFNQNRDDEAFSVKLQAGGFIVAAGYAEQAKIVGVDDDFALARYDSVGNLAGGFGTGGKQTVDFTRDTTFPSTDRIEEIQIQTDGQIVAAGWAWEPSAPPRNDVAVARFSPTTGALDASLEPNNGGLLFPQYYGFGDNAANALALDSTGNLVLLGQTGNAPTNFGLQRITPAGALDTTFANAGRQVADFTEFVGSVDMADAVLVQPDGKILVAGSTSLLGNEGASLARYNTDGTLDRTFGNGGRIATSLLANIVDLVRRPDGRIVAVGSTPGGTDFGVIQLLADGTLDVNGFGNRGFASIDFAGALDTPQAAVLQADGKLVIAGSAGGADFGIVRLTTSGNLDPTFDADGKATVDFGSATESANDVAIDANGRIVLAGTAAVGVGGTNDFALARLDASGVLDATFSSDGKVTTDFNQNRDDDARSLVLQAGGFIVVGGTAIQQKLPANIDADFALARYNNSGDLQLGFGVGGKKTIDFTRDTLAPSEDTLGEIALDANGQIVVAGTSAEPGPTGRVDVAAVRLNGVTAAVDTSTDLNTGGKLYPAFFGIGPDNGLALALQADGKWVIAGSTLTNASYGVLRLTTTGQADATFGSAGRVVTDFTEFVGSEDSAEAVVVQPDGKLIVGGLASFGGVDHAAFARYNADGTLDTSFGIGGRITTTLINGAFDLALLASGKVLAVGPTSMFPGGVNFGVLQLNSDGSLDTANFGSRGLAFADFAGLIDLPQAIVVNAATGKITVAGSAESAGGVTDFGIARFTSSGNLDPTLDVDGKATVDFGSANETAYDVALDTSGRIVLAGSARTGVGATLDFALARLENSGVLDATFNLDGRVTTDFFQNRDDEAFSLVLQPGGFMIAAGYASQSKVVGPDDDFALARYSDNGDLQGGFGTGGKVTTDFTRDTSFPSDDRIGEIKALPDGRIVAAGQAWEAGAPSRRDVAAGAYQGITGALEATVDPNTGGRVFPPFYGFGDNGANGLAIDNNGRWVLVGQNSEVVSNFGVQRLEGFVPVNPDVAYTIRVLDQSGTAELARDLATNRYRVGPGDIITIEVTVDDLRAIGASGGISSAYADLTYDLDFLDWRPGTLTISPSYPNTHSGTLNDPAQLLDEAGGFASSTALGDAPRVLFTVQAQVKASAPAGGTFNLSLDAADSTPFHDTIQFAGGTVPLSKISYEKEGLLVNSAPQFLWRNPSNPLDVNNDGVVSNADAQALYDFLALGGPRAVPAPPAVPPPYYDVHGDGVVNALDVLDVLTYLNANPLELAPTSASAVAAPQMVTTADLAPVVSAAIELFAAAGASDAQVARLQQAQVQVGDLAGSILALQSGNVITIDTNAAGRGWFVDPTPTDNAEFQLLGNRLAAIDSVLTSGDVDLLTVVAHELGHLLGFPDEDSQSEDLMAAELTIGTRRLPRL